MHIGKNIRAARLRLGISQEELGAAVKVTGQAVSQWERGETVPEVEKVPTLAKKLGVPVSEIHSGVGQDVPPELIELWKRLPTKEAQDRVIAVLRAFAGHPA